MIKTQKIGMESYDAIQKFDKLCFPVASWWLSMVKDKRTTYYALIEDGKIIGNLTTYNWSGKYDYMKIMGLSVHPDYRNQGLATKLMKYAEEECKTSGLKKISAEIPADNVAMHKLLEKCGYEKDTFVNNFVYHPQETSKYYYINPLFIEQDEKEQNNDPVPSRKVINIAAEPVDVIPLTASKFGGYPYWPKDMEYPVNSNGEKLILLAQINLSDVTDPLLPKEGLLQFFISNDDVLGYDDEKGYKVIYHKDIDPTVSETTVKDLGIRAACDLDPDKDEYFPLYKCYSITFEEGFDKKADEDSEDYESTTTGNKLFGYPYFTQYDPREDGEYDIQLLQMDSSYGRGNEIMWGDSGVGHFFIEEKDLKALNFDNAFYTWDCC